jgi:acetyl-CoA acetyltransferase
VKFHQAATKNPFSQYCNEVTLDDIINARMVAFPNTLYMGYPTGDGAAAAILVSEDKQVEIARRWRHRFGIRDRGTARLRANAGGFRSGRRRAYA